MTIRVWTALCGVPSGSTITYAALAARIGELKAVRAVANACAANAIALAIPCHRRTGQARLGCRPSKKSIKHAVDNIHALTARSGNPKRRHVLRVPLGRRTQAHADRKGGACMNLPGVDTYVGDASATEGCGCTRPKSAPCQMDAESRLLALLSPREMSDLSPHLKRTLLGRSHLSRFYEYTPN
jgi:O-6-methylguanine DNA methyltransferase